MSKVPAFVKQEREMKRKGLLGSTKKTKPDDLLGVNFTGVAPSEETVVTTLPSDGWGAPDRVKSLTDSIMQSEWWNNSAVQPRIDYYTPDPIEYSEPRLKVRDKAWAEAYYEEPVVAPESLKDQYGRPSAYLKDPTIPGQNLKEILNRLVIETNNGFPPEGVIVHDPVSGFAVRVSERQFRDIQQKIYFDNGPFGMGDSGPSNKIRVELIDVWLREAAKSNVFPVNIQGDDAFRFIGYTTMSPEPFVSAGPPEPDEGDLLAAELADFAKELGF